MKLVAKILSVICYIFGVLFIWGAFGTPFDSTSLIIGIIMLVIASVILIIVTRKGAQEKEAKNVTYNIDLGGKTEKVVLTCNNCGAPLPKEAITVVAGAPMVTCPYCGVTYQITEEPKW